MTSHLYDLRWEVEYVRTVRVLAAFGERVETRLGWAREMPHPVQLHVLPSGWLQVEGRGGSATFARLEQLCYLAGAEPWVLGMTTPRYDELCRWTGEEPYPDAYGPRMRGQLVQVVRELAKNPHSRRAVVGIHERYDTNVLLNFPDRPVPCTVALHFTVRGDEVFVHAMMRSCDAWLGLYYDVPAFAFLGRCVGIALGKNLGGMTLSVTSLHLYEEHLGLVPHLEPRVKAVISPLAHLDVPTAGDPAELWQFLVAWARREVAAAEARKEKNR